MAWLIQTGGGWRPGIGDPSLLGWLTVAAYFGAGLACYRAWRSTSRRGPQYARLALGWGALAALMFFLGVNKQLDLQSLFTVVGRQIARDHGWYDQRRTVQVWFILALGTSAIGATLAGCWLMRQHLREFRLALIGGAIITLFVLVRAASFHHFDAVLRSSIFGLRMNWLLELAGIGCVAIAARKRTPRPRSRRFR